MPNDVVRQQQTWRMATIAAISGLAVLASTGALADDDEREWKHHGHGRYFVPPGHVYYAPPVFYAPRPMIVYSPPVYYEPAPVYYPPPGVTINIPLR